jgi:hypothetical protein
VVVPNDGESGRPGSERRRVGELQVQSPHAHHNLHPTSPGPIGASRVLQQAEGGRRKVTVGGRVHYTAFKPRYDGRVRVVCDGQKK